MALYTPTIQSEYFVEGLLNEETWASLLASGVIDLSTLEEIWNNQGAASKAGEFINIPTLNNPAAFARVDRSASSGASFTHAASTDDKAVTLSDYSGNQFKEHDRIITGANFDQLWSQRYGEEIATRLLGQMCRILNGSIDACDTPSSNCHTLNAFSAGAIKVHTIRRALRLMGDKSRKLTTMVIHSDVWSDLLADLIHTYKIDMVAGTVINNGKLDSVMGIRNVIVYDDSAMIDTGTYGSVGDDTYSTYFLGDNLIVGILIVIIAILAYSCWENKN